RPPRGTLQEWAAKRRHRGTRRCRRVVRRPRKPTSWWWPRETGDLMMKTKHASALPEKTGYTKYFEHDGALRAYANRMTWFGISAVLISFVLAILLFYVRVQP